MCSFIYVDLQPYLQQVFALQVPLLDAVVPRAAEEHVPLDHQRLDTVVMRGLEVVRGADAALRAFSHVEELEHRRLQVLIWAKPERI